MCFRLFILFVSGLVFCDVSQRLEQERSGIRSDAVIEKRPPPVVAGGGKTLVGSPNDLTGHNQNHLSIILSLLALKQQVGASSQLLIRFLNMAHW